jgi:nucleotide-binding universal stress UspA family protein
MVVLDGSEPTEEILQRIRRINSVTGADVLVLCVLEPRLALEPFEDSLTDEASQAEARRYLDEVAQQLALGGTHITTKVTTGLRIAEAVAGTARQCGTDLILLVDS